eukprot:6085551-Amphidinium_carterae.2
MACTAEGLENEVADDSNTGQPNSQDRISRRATGLTQRKGRPNATKRPPRCAYSKGLKGRVVPRLNVSPTKQM